MNKNLKQQAVRLHEDYLNQFFEEAARLKKWSEILIGKDDPFDRKSFGGHITASLVVVSPDGAEALVIEHPYLKAWMPPGGHVEAVAQSLWDAALLEAFEEAGVEAANLSPIEQVSGSLLDVDVHPIPANPVKGEPAHDHCDLMFVARARERFEPKPSEGDAVQSAAWMSFESWFRGDLGERERRCAQKLARIGVIPQPAIDKKAALKS